MLTIYMTRLHKTSLKSENFNFELYILLERSSSQISNDTTSIYNLYSGGGRGARGAAAPGGTLEGRILMISRVQQFNK